MKATIDTITITVGEQKLSFTLAEAEALRAILNEKLGKRDFPEFQVRERIVEKPVYIPPVQKWRDIASPVRFYEPNIICRSSGESIMALLNA